MSIDNSAQSLRDFFLKLKKQTHPNTKESLFQAFEITQSQENEVLLWDKISKVMSLIKKTEDTIQDYFPDENVPVPHWKNSSIQFFANLNLNESLVNTIGRINDDALNELGMLAILFKTKGQIGEFKNEDIEEIMQQLNELKDSIINSSFAPEVKKDVLYYINNMIRAFEDYKITGIEPIISATEATMGHACMSDSFNNIVTTTDEGSKLKNIIIKTLASINSIDGIVSLGANATTLLGYFK